MASFNTRRGGRAFQFLSDLREVNENPAVPDEAAILALDENDISIYTNTEFYDIETGQNTDFQPQPSKADTDTHGSQSGNSPSVMEDFSSMDFMSSE